MFGQQDGTMGSDARAAPVTSAEDMLREEFAHVVPSADWSDRSKTLPELIAKLHAGDADKRPAALCLSGGGIRSATFSLGVMQWLAGHEQLNEFQYLSSVSGGGYTASFVVNALRQAYMQAFNAELEAGRDQATADAAGQKQAKAWMRRLGNSAGADHAANAAGAARITNGGGDPVAPLRAYSNYLSPTGGLSTDSFALGAIFLRNLLLNLLVWLPLLAVAVALPRIYIALLDNSPPIGLGGIQTLPLALLVMVLILFGIAYIVADLPAPRERPAVPTGHKQPAAAMAEPAPMPADRFDWLCFWPITSAAVLLSLFGVWASDLRAAAWWHFALAGAGAHVLGIVLGLPWRLKMRKLKARPGSLIAVGVVVAVGAAGGALASLVVAQAGSGEVGPTISALQQLIYASLAVPAMTGAFWLAMTLQAGLLGRVTTEEDREWWARATAAWLKFSLFWVLAFALVVWAPLLILEHAAEAGLTAAKFGIGSGALGVATALIGYWSKNGAQVKSKAQNFLNATGTNLLNAMSGLVIVAILLALSLSWNVVLERCHGWDWAKPLCRVDVRAQTDFLREQSSLGAAAAGAAGNANVQVLPPEPDPTRALIAELGSSTAPQVYAHVLLNGSGWAVLVACLLLLLIAYGMSRCMGANQFSLHGMYGNRLIRAFLGSGRRVRHPHWFTGFDPDDNPKLHDLAEPLRAADGSPRLFPLVNMALNLVKPSQKRLDWQQRKAASFFASPLHCGSAHLGFRPTRYYVEGMSLGRAMTISGAAASPNMGYHSAGLVTLVMTLFNVRLGWWSPNPAVHKRWFEDQPPIGLKILLAEAGGATGDEDPFAYLSDGGHFDNTGIYEMVRRRCRRIVVVDTTCDGEFKWKDLLDAVRKIRVDFGVPIDLHGELPGADRISQHPRWLKGTIKYSSRDPDIRDGELIVLKPMVLPGDPPELAAYARDSAKEGSAEKDPNRFPHQSTADQFYDEQQFESYRLLGYVTAQEAFTPGPVSPRTGAASGGGTGPAMTPLAAPVPSGERTANPTQAASSIGQFANQVGTSMALATAVTVGGTLGIAGTVALQPSQISLSAEDRDLLRTGIKGSVDVGNLKLTDQDRWLLSNPVQVKLDEQTVERLTVATQQMEAAVKLLAAWKPGPPPGGSATQVTFDTKSYEALNNLSVALVKATSSGEPASAGSLQALANAVKELKVSLEKLPEDEKLTKALGRVVEGLSNTVASSSPRRNIRGQEGGSR